MTRCVANELHQQDSIVDIIGVARFGHDFYSLTTSDNELVRNYEELLEPTSEKGAYIITHIFLPRWLITILPWRLNKVVVETTQAIKKKHRVFWYNHIQYQIPT